MLLLERWLSELSPSHRILDLGCGAGSLRTQVAGLRVIGVDLDPNEFARNRDLPAACAESHSLPFACQSFDFVICHHSLEHFQDAQAAIREIRRVLKPGGRLFVSVPDGGSFSDLLYRLLLCGGGHLQRFTFQSVVRAIQAGTGLRLAGCSELFTSFIFVEKRNFVLAPRGRLSGPLPRRVRWFGRLPAFCFDVARICLNLGSRFLDRCFGTGFSRYGWALAFGPELNGPLETEQGRLNVCMGCGAALYNAGEGARLQPVARLLYRCPYCAGLNFLFAETKKRAPNFGSPV